MSELPKVGTPADELCKMKDRTFLDAEGWCGHAVGEGAVEWRYADCVVTLAHDGQMYRVVEVREVDRTASD